MEQWGGAGGNWHWIAIMHDARMRKNEKFTKLFTADRPALLAL
jgi:hypothetical protein